MSTINAISSTRTNGNSTLDRIPLQTLGQDDFLRLLVAQMAAQDPLNPQKDTDFIAQMASFSSLEQAKTMQTDLAGLRSDQQLLQANALLGRTVIIQNADQTAVSGLVSAVQMEAGTPKVVVNGQAYDLRQLSAILPTAIENN